MKLRFILIGILVIVWGYFIYINMPQEEKIIRENIAREVSLQAELIDKISKAENQIKQLQEAISWDRVKILASVEVVNAYNSIISVKWYGISAPVNKPSSDANTWWLQAPSEKVKEYLRHCQLTKDGELVTDWEWNWILETPYTGTMEWFTFVPDCGAFMDKDNNPIRGCYIRQDWSNCFAE